MESCTLALFDANRKARLDIDINPRITSVQLSTSVNRGFDTLQIGIAPENPVEREGVRYGQLPEPLATRAWTRAELWIGNYLAFEGRLGPQTVPATALVINGYWQALATDDWYSSSSTTLTSAGELIKTMLASSVLPVRPGNAGEFNDPLSEHAPIEFDGKAISDALNLIVNEGDALGNDLDWYVWDERRLHLASRTPPAMPDYRMDIDQRKMQIISNPDQMLSAVTVEFRAAANSIVAITSGNTNVTVTHGIGVTPTASQVNVWALSDLGPATKFYVDNITSTTFRINLVRPERQDGTATITSAVTFVDVTHGLSRTPTADELKVTATNALGAGQKFYISNIGASTFRINLVEEEKGSGTATITSAATTVDVTHGRSRTPAVNEITLVPTNSPTNDPGNVWISNLGASTFRVNVRNVPGASTATFGWKIRYQDTPAAAVPGTPTATFAWEAVFADVMVAADPGATQNFGWSVNAGAQRTSEATNPDFEREYGFIRRPPPFKVGSMTLAAANRIRDRLIASAHRPRYSVRLELGPDDVLYGPHKEPVAVYTARAGRWAVFGDLPQLILVAAKLDMTGQRYALDFGDRLPDFSEILRRLERAEMLRQRSIDPDGGGTLA